MIQNQVLKFFLLNTVFRVFSVINRCLPHNKSRILLYSNLGFRDNTKAIYDFLIENKYYTKYKITCATNDYRKFTRDKYPNVVFRSNKYGILEYLLSGTVFYSFGKIPIKPHKKQNVVQMWHGTPLKAPGTSQLASSKEVYYTHVFASADMFKAIMCDWFLCPLDIVCVNGHPRTDIFFRKIKRYNLGVYNKMVLWTPTFRQSATLGYSDVSDAPLIPVIDNSELKKIDDYLCEKHVKIIIKLHPLQDLSKYKLMDMSNLMIMSHDDFTKKQLDLYTIAAQSDALITDYSSIYFDYLLLNRPIGFTEDDVESFEEQRGFSIKNPNDFKPGMKIKTIDDLYRFIDDLSAGKDEYLEMRKKINNLVNKYHDGNNSQRALELVDIYL